MYSLGVQGILGCENLLIYYENSVGLMTAWPRWIYDLDIFIIYSKEKGLYMISNSLFNSFQKEGHFAPQYVQYHIYGTLNNKCIIAQAGMRDCLCQKTQFISPVF